ncbi:MAG: hypothetical protein EKK29_13760 [Hyphomicrobiales bacterium]|nr:MAG: hypothetical protein EKK29_13760 [Hyphomicrobiales bacterium]
MADTADTTQKAHSNRLARLGHHLSAAKRKPIVELNAKAKLLIEYMATGCPHPWVSQITRASPTELEPDRRRPLEPGEPMKLDEAADLLRIRRRRAREIMQSPAAQKELARQLQGLRSGMKARAMAVLGAILEDEGDGTAATKTVRLKAANAILGEEQRNGGVNVHINNGPILQAGVVVRLPSGIAAPPLESNQPGPTRIEQRPTDLEARAVPDYAPIHADDEADA